MNNYGYTYTYNYELDQSFLANLNPSVIAGIAIAILALVILSIIGMWRLYTKAGKPGWTSIIPIYNYIVLLEIVELPMWFIVLFIIPFVNVYAVFKVNIELAHKFGKSTFYGVMLTLFSPILIPILGFGRAEYIGNYSEMNQNMINEQMKQEQENMNKVQESLGPCPYCNTESKPGDLFCNNCGSRLK